ncbi:MAG: chromosome segregation SMC family protein [Bullifex sp.]
MFLKCLDIIGFKSFADKTHIDFADGITSLLGSNGCGKSNIVDSIKWVLGEQSTKTLRAGRMEDVIFNGTDKRKPLAYAEVALTIDNSEKHLPTDLTEVEIKRRVFRSGESEYYINKNRCLLKNIRELFFDTGVGKSAYSILEQGKIDQILSQRPEDRRYIFEEAAGISRFKAECNEAAKKIERTNENIAQAENLMKVEKRSYESLRSQAEKAKSYNELVKRQLALDVDIHYSKLKTFLALKDMRAERNRSLAGQIASLRSSLEDYKVNIEEEQARMQAESQKSHNLQYAINRAEESINSRNEKITFLENSYRDYINAKKEAEARAESIRTSIERDRNELSGMEAELDEKYQIYEESGRQVKRATAMLTEDQVRIGELREKSESEEKLVSEAEKAIEDLSVELKDTVEQLASELDRALGQEYSVSKRDEAEKAFLSLLERTREKISFRQKTALFSDAGDDIVSAIDEIKNAFLTYKKTIPPVMDSFLSPGGLLTRKREISEKEAVLRSSIERSRERIRTWKNDVSSLESEMEGLRETVKGMEIRLAAIKAGMDSFRTVKENLERSIEEKELNLADSQSAVTIAENRISAVADQLRAADKEKAELQGEIVRLKDELKGLQDEISLRYSELSAKEKEKNDTIDTINHLSNEVEKNELWISNTDELIGNLYASFYNTYSRNLREFSDRMDAELPEQVLLENELVEVKKQLQALGPNINHMAVDEFEGAKERYEFLQKQLDDMYKSRTDLETVLDEIQTRSREMFLATYKQISENFQLMFRRLFGGGRAEITLSDPENVLSSGIDIFAQPPGKKLISLTLLSGGERSMTAVALLFATYMVKPSPFCILDEIDAALDDKNIGFFLSVLEDFAKDSQFIIITHNKHTVMGSQSLLGVTQMEAGVSTTVSYRLARIAGEAVILNEDDAEVDFDSEGRRR